MDKLKSAWAWVKAHAVWLAGALVALVGVLALIASRRSGRQLSFDEALRVRRETREIAGKQARADVLMDQGDAAAPEVERLKSEIAASKRRVVEINEGQPLQELSDEEVAARFRASGL
jgi:hypothetical protein